ncbi:MAG: NADH-quinone oxidoreductase subunit NuoB [Azospirillaceae bacterium]|nr:NADH-quinone oxidoreductase subunit NuoB [Azospirillaceae bacterium]
MLKRLLRTLWDGPQAMTGPAPNEEWLAGLVARLDHGAHALLGRSLAIRQVDAGSCNGCELEINALSNPYYDLERLGLRFVASPRHADVLLVTGPVTANMGIALARTWQATPEPKWVVAAGACAINGGVFAGSYACIGSVASIIPVDLEIPGCPPRPVDLLVGLVTLIEASAATPGR